MAKFDRPVTYHRKVDCDDLVMIVREGPGAAGVRLGVNDLVRQQLTDVRLKKGEVGFECENGLLDRSQLPFFIATEQHLMRSNLV
jgi:hypothetical protein